MSNPPPPPPRWPTATKVGIGLGLLAVLILAIALALTGGSDETPATTAAPATSSQPSPTDPSTTTTHTSTTSTTSPATTTSTSTTTSTTSTSTTTSTTSTTTTTLPPRPELLDNDRAVLSGETNILWQDLATQLVVDGLPDGEFRINTAWWLVSTEPQGFEGCSGDPRGFVDNPIPLSILGLTPGWHGCSHGGRFVIELQIHEVYENGIDLEWWVWLRP